MAILTILKRGSDHVRRLLCSSRPVAIQTSLNHSVSDQDLQQQLNQIHTGKGLA
ncbi:unnamed protein product [Sphenostylis stenocarpa]|uniref:Uncharacterized protein n=1 Tax=Sphenostylis stenocarpa TaxID=92480 RepID=A0AA86VRX6_9FABA|nr:unnamed protein product [Sphenostylis stenocarpa]